MTISETGRGYDIQFDYRPNIVRELKAMYGVRFQGKEKGWSVPHVGVRKNPDGTTTNLSNKEAMERFKRKYIVVSEGADAEEQIFKIDELPDLKVELPWKDGVKPFGYQNKGIARGMELKRFINGDMPGTGKTIQSIGTCLALEASGVNPFPCLIICPATLKENWRREIEDKFSKKRAIILHDKNRNTWHQYYRMGMADFFVINYESLWSYFVIATTNKKCASVTLKDIQFNPLISMFKAVIFDEGHKLRNTQTKTSKVARGITAGKEIVMLLTGTPVVNSPKDLAALLAIIGRLGEFGGYRYFLDRYCQGGTGSGNLGELNGKMNKLCFFRREKKDVLKELPDKMREVFTCDISTQAEYNAAKGDLGKYLKEQGYSEKQVNKSLNAEIMVKIGKLKAISARGKLAQAVEHIQEIVDAGEKIVVFINSKVLANSLMEAFPGSVSVRGTELDENGKEKAQSLDSRQRAVDAFQNDPRVNVIVCSIKAAGVGITLTASSRLMFLELPWHPADVEQCEDRCHRVGQKNSVQISYFLGKGTIDEDIYKIIEAKRVMSDAITGTQTSIDTIITDLTRSLFNQR